MHTFMGRYSSRGVHLNKDGAIISIKNAASKQWQRGAARLVAANKLIINVVP